MLAHSAIKEPSGYQTRANIRESAPVRVILPESAEPAQPPQPSTVAVSAPEQAQPVKEIQAQAPVEKQVENVDTRKAEAAEGRRERRRRYVERNARMMVARAKKMEQMRQGPERGGSGCVRALRSPSDYLPSSVPSIECLGDDLRRIGCISKVPHCSGTFVCVFCSRETE